MIDVPTFVHELDLTLVEDETMLDDIFTDIENEDEAAATVRVEKINEIAQALGLPEHYVP